MRIVTVIQARLGSSRLPAKVMLDLAGKPALERCLARARRIIGVDEVVVATSIDATDDVLETACDRLGARCVRGSQADVLDRFLTAARATSADAIVRITSDCPLLDPVESSRVVTAFASDRVDYTSNVQTRMYPRGLDTEVFSRDALERAARDATTTPEREHVTLRMYARRELFRCSAVTPTDGEDLSHLRWTLDTLDDYRALHALHALLGPRAEIAGYKEIVALLAEHPEIGTLNAHIEQKVA